MKLNQHFRSQGLRDHNTCIAEQQFFNHCQTVPHGVHFSEIWRYFQKCCPKKNKTAAVVEKDTSDTDTCFFMGSLRADNNDMPWYEVLQVNNESMKFKLDSGADVSIISENEYQNMRPKPKLKHTDVKLNGVSANIDLCGYFDAVGLQWGIR